jgi:hypothetical protein
MQKKPKYLFWDFQCLQAQYFPNKSLCVWKCGCV